MGTPEFGAKVIGIAWEIFPVPTPLEVMGNDRVVVTTGIPVAIMAVFEVITRLLSASV